MSRTTWITSAAAAALALLTASPPQAAPDRDELRPAGIELTASAPARAAASRQAVPAAESPVKLSQACDPASVAVRQTTTCTITAENTGAASTTVDLNTVTTLNLPMTAAAGATLTTPFTARAPRATLAGTRAAGPVSVAPDPGQLFGYIPLTAFGGNTVIPLEDETIFNLDVPGFVFNETSYARVGITSNGYLVAGGGEQADVSPAGTLPDPARPNNVIAPFWGDLDGTGTTGALANVLTDGVGSWIVIEWQVNTRGTADQKVFQVWLGINGVQDVQFAYRFDTINAGQQVTVGAENADGTTGVQLPAGTVPTSDLRVTSAAAQPGGKVSYTVTAKGLVRGPGHVLTVGRTPAASVPLTVTTPVTVTR
ncbi:hypothetical protein AB0F81_07570 [Actinoplanes sp. NPDC024001]|uniref:hypothetical protein n=1 Tax=Actinoplanes sp. NPDC024001 TaxID=3154598 RepID=UPI0033EA88CC